MNEHCHGVLTMQPKIPSPLSAAVYLSGWYLASLVTLFLNKHILSTLNGNPQTLAMVQMTTTCVMGAAKVTGCGAVEGLVTHHSIQTVTKCGAVHGALPPASSWFRCTRQPHKALTIMQAALTIRHRCWVWGTRWRRRAARLCLACPVCP